MAKPLCRSRYTNHRIFGVAAALAFGAGAAYAQSVRGEVRSATTLLPLPHTTVVLAPAFPPRFSDDAGRFAFADVQPGAYRLTLKYVGYLPFDTVVNVVSGQDVVLRLALHTLAVELPPVTVVANQSCTTPGPPDPAANPKLSAIFDQLRENASRFTLLADTYPFRHWVFRQERFGRTGVTETIDYRSDARRRYAPGRLVTGSGASKLLHLPTIADLADSAFHSAHCFSFGGIERLEDVAHYRVDFLAADHLSRPDVEGTAWLDSATFALRQLVLRLTRPERAVKGIANVEVTAEFSDILPALSLPNFVRSVTSFTDRKGIRVEEQSFVRLEFLRAKPGGQ